MASVGSVITDIEAPFKSIEGWFKTELPITYQALVAEAKKEYPALSADLWSKFEQLAQGIASEVEKAMASADGDKKWAVGFAALVAALKYYGVKTLSVGTMETLLQDAVPIVRAGLVAVTSPDVMAMVLAALEAAGIAI